MIRRPPRSTHCISSAASDVYKRQEYMGSVPGMKSKSVLRSSFTSSIVAGARVIHFISVPRSLILASVYSALSATQQLLSSKLIACCVFKIILMMLFLSDSFPENALVKSGKPN
eukprot:TRINITY_DN4187_c0_g1_i1.p7 TRINITY_DN4187_c0_g1~~TRINITY_DN4187_c0_g1_i1.p7  ORF type:complete len:114 (-),score=11.20 TRINITY_DN4187_c0_g1_i1:2409-2750(-)